MAIVFKSAVTGEIVTEEYAKEHPNETYKETLPDK